jgi:hypothetical protein
LIIAPGQNESVVLCRMERTLPEEVHEMMPSIRVREGTSHGSGRCPSVGSIGLWCNNLESQGAWPLGGMSAITSEITLGRSLGVGTESP